MNQKQHHEKWVLFADFLRTVQKNTCIQAMGIILSLKMQYIKYKIRTQNLQDI